eukprot:TRINITY_DN9806_c0_g4_i1.p1 TRINITY_DN9806_c0_g4~~TRINITY_DN9806_c0_g4_i1.p1  ORF type:complete len:161 (-),score=26.60 TRINITY_DN9806_c0_g4_i1:79-561(-)
MPSSMGFARLETWVLLCICLERSRGEYVGLILVSTTLSLIAFSKQGFLDEALGLFSEMVGNNSVSPDVVTYTSLIQVCCNLNRWEEGTRLYNEMIDRHIFPDVLTINILLNAFCKQGMMEKAHELFDVVIQRGEKLNASSYNTLMDDYCLQEKMDIAAHL